MQLFTTWEGLALTTAAVMLNVVGFIAWRRGAVDQRYRAAVAVASLALIVGYYYSYWLRAFGTAAAVLLAFYGFTAWIRHRQGLLPGMHRSTSPAALPTDHAQL